jgi:hypothetical protein
VDHASDLDCTPSGQLLESLEVVLVGSVEIIRVKVDARQGQASLKVALEVGGVEVESEDSVTAEIRGLIRWELKYCRVEVVAAKAWD